MNSLPGRPKATKHDFEFAHDRIAMGIGRKKMFVSDKAKLTTAYHEGGHALASLFTEGAMPLHKVTILPRGPSLGHVYTLPFRLIIIPRILNRLLCFLHKMMTSI